MRPDSPGRAHIKKRLIVACDGTWLNTDSGEERKLSLWPWAPAPVKSDPSNVTRICRAITTQSRDGVPQICNYEEGVGASSDVSVHLLGGLAGRGIAENIRDGYAFIANNWNEGDEIIILGFSRGAFTARSIAGLIEAVGVLTVTGLAEFQLIFKDWENQLDPSYEYKWPPSSEIAKSVERPTFKNGRYCQELADRHLTTQNVPIKAIGVWDTVGSLGIPNIGLIQLKSNWKEFTFANSEVPSNVEYAFQALALDEHRGPFSPTLWERPTGKAAAASRLKLLKQTWFPGVHSNVGGSYADAGLANVTLAWMIAQLQEHDILDVDRHYLLEQHRLHQRFYALQAPPQPPRPWALGRVYDSFSALYTLAGSRTRTPGRYTRTDPRTDGATQQRLVLTEEAVHPSVRIRRALGGKGQEDKGVYASKALEGWELVAPNAAAPESTSPTAERNPTRERYRWVSRQGSDVVVLPEDELGAVEMELLRQSPEVYEKFKGELV